MSAGPAPIAFDVFGARLRVERAGNGWRASWVGNEGKLRDAGPIIPDLVAESDLEHYLDDLFHESATPARPRVTRLPAP